MERLQETRVVTGEPAQLHSRDIRIETVERSVEQRDVGFAFVHELGAEDRS